MATVRRIFATYNGPDGLSSAYYEYDDITQKILGVGVIGLASKGRCRLGLITEADGVERESTLTQSAEIDLASFNLLMIESEKLDETGKIVLQGWVAAEWQ